MVEGNALIFDIIRKKYVHLSPEEWVRQHVIAYLTDEIGVPPGLISVERALEFNGMKKRFDICVADRMGKMTLLVECKAPNVAISDAVLRQAGIYTKALGVKGIFLSNGLQHHYLQLHPETLTFEVLDSIPPFRNWI